MQFKSFFKDLYEAAAQEKLQNEQYPYGGFDMSDSDAELMNTNENDEMQSADESIFKMMVTAKKDALKPLASRKPTVEPPSTKSKVQPEPKVYSVPTEPTSADEFREMMAKARQKRLEKK